MSSLLPITNAFLADKDTRIRAKQIPWDGYQRAGLLTAEDVALIQRISSAHTANTSADAILSAEGETYAALYVRLLTKLSRNDTLQYVLVLVGDMLHDHDDRTALFLNLPSSESCYTPLLKLLESTDQYLQLKSSVIISTILSSSTAPPPKDVVSKLLTHLSNLIRNKEDSEGVDIAVQCLEGVLRLSPVRKAAWNSDVVSGLVELLKGKPGSQMQYQLGFCFWELTFEKEIAEGIHAKHQLLPLLLTLARSALKEKVLRVALSTFRNLILLAPSNNLPAMLVLKVQDFLESLKGRKWADEEVEDDLEWLRAELKTGLEGLTTWDEYLLELNTGALSWTPPHSSEEFWLQNAPKLVARDREVLKKLIALLLSPQSPPLVLAVAANDVAQFVKYHDTGKKAIDDLGAKSGIMRLMEHEDKEVRYQSLVALQRLLGVGYA